MKRSGVYVSSGNPEDVIEVCASRDFARLRAAKLSRKMGRPLYVWEWSEETGLRKCFASGTPQGLVFWRKPCRFCGETADRLRDSAGEGVGVGLKKNLDPEEAPG